MPLTKVHRQRNRSQAVGLMLAGAVIPKTFQPSLMPRSTVDQGLITGLTIALVYIMGVVFQDIVELGTESVLPEDQVQLGNEEDGVALNTSAIVGLLAAGTGFYLQKKFPYTKDERLTQSSVRTSGYWMSLIGLAGLTYGAIEGINNAVSKDDESAADRNLIPYVIGAGLLFSLLGEIINTKGDRLEAIKRSAVTTKPLRVVAMGSAVAGLLGSLAYAERLIARVVDRTIQKNAPYLNKAWLPLGHLITAGALAYGVFRFMGHTYRNIENNAQNMEAGFSRPPSTPLSSGSKPSAVHWSTVAVQGRRHIGSKLSANQIEAVMNEQALEPIRIFIGLDSAPSEEDRVAMALHELDRTSAWDREAIIVVSPTGTGYINYVMSESVEYMTRGNVVSVALQYSKRPSPMSLDRVDEGFRQYRMLLNGIRRKLQTMPTDRRPRILLFGESLGAWTSQNAFVNEGTDGLQYLGIDSALWIGTPAGSKWKDQVLSGKMLNTEADLIGSFDSYDDVKQLTKKEKDTVRYVLLTHHNDPIAQFGLDLLVKQPDWVDDPTKRPKEMNRRIAYRTPTLFVQMLFGMKNALKPIPGEFVAHGHDYRKDLAEFVRYSYRFEVTRPQLNRIEKALRQNELDRQAKIELGVAEDAS